MDIIAISTATSRIETKLQKEFISAIRDKDSFHIVVNMNGQEISIPVVNGVVIATTVTSSIRNLINRTLGVIQYSHESSLTVNGES